MQDRIHEQLIRFCDDEFAGKPDERDRLPEIKVVEGHCASVILKEATANEADVIVMGTHGHTVLGEIVLGSVAHKVIHKSPIPIMLVPFAMEARGD